MLLQIGEIPATKVSTDDCLFIQLTSACVALFRASRALRSRHQDAWPSLWLHSNMYSTRRSDLETQRPHHAIVLRSSNICRPEISRPWMQFDTDAHFHTMLGFSQHLRSKGQYSRKTRTAPQGIRAAQRFAQEKCCIATMDEQCPIAVRGQATASRDHWQDWEQSQDRTTSQVIILTYWQQ